MRYILVMSVAISMITPTALNAFDYELLPLGAEAKSHAGATVLGTVGAPAALHNPANLSEINKNEPYGELSAIALSYKYKHPDFKNAELNLNLPIASYGLSGVATRKIKFGLVGLLAPASAQKIDIKNVPTRQISEEAMLVNIESNGGRSTSYILGGGLSYSLGRLSLGLSAVTMKIYGRTILRDPNSNEVVMDISHDIQHFFGVAGFRWQPNRWLLVGGSYQIAYKPEYTVRSNAAEGSSVKYKGFKGQQAKFAARLKKGTYALLTELQYRQHQRTRGDIFNFLTADAVTRNQDTLSYVIGAERSFMRGSLGYNFGFFPTYVSDGMIASRSESNTEFKGNTFGNLDGITRTTHSIYTSFSTGIGHQTLGVSYTSGQRKMDEDTRGYGSYKLESLVVSYGSRISF